MPYQKDGPGSIEFDFGLLQDVQSSMHYLTWFNDKFNGFVDHLIQIAEYMHNKEHFYLRQINIMSEQLDELELQNRELKDQMENVQDFKKQMQREHNEKVSEMQVAI